MLAVDGCRNRRFFIVCLDYYLSLPLIFGAERQVLFCQSVSSGREVVGGVDRVAIFPDFKMQLGPVRAAVSQFSDDLSGFNVLPFLHQNLPVVSISTQIVLVVVHYDQVAITEQPTSGINDITTCRRPYRITCFSSNINTFIDFPGCRITCNYGANVGPAPVDIGYCLALTR